MRIAIIFLATFILPVILEKIAETNGWTSTMADGTVNFYMQWIHPAMSFIIGPFGLGAFIAFSLTLLPEIPFIVSWLKNRDLNRKNALIQRDDKIEDEVFDLSLRDDLYPRLTYGKSFKRCTFKYGKCLISASDIATVEMYDCNVVALTNPSLSEQYLFGGNIKQISKCKFQYCKLEYVTIYALEPQASQLARNAMLKWHPDPDQLRSR